jgi:alpha-galactosidase
MHDPTLALTPPMGWNSWNALGNRVDEAAVRANAEALVATGLAAAGYRYVVIDDCWHDGRDRSGRLRPDARRFPAGIRALADAVHALGLRFGIYSCAGVRTCAGLPGSYGLEELDARTFAEWGVDFLKYDYCHAPAARDEAIRRYTAMGEALANCGRPIVFSACEWGTREPWTFPAIAHGHCARTTFDIIDAWDGKLDYDNRGVTVCTILDRQHGLHEYAAPGRWNDMDMLVVGLRGKGSIGGGGCTPEEYRSHFGLWCLHASPLFIGCDLRSVATADLDIMRWQAAIDVNQDPCGHQAQRVARQGRGEVYLKALDHGSYALGLLNRGDLPAVIGHKPWGRFQATDLGTGADLGVVDGLIEREVEPHALALIRLTPIAS